MLSYSPLSILARVSDRRSTQKGWVVPIRLMDLVNLVGQVAVGAVLFSLLDELLQIRHFPRSAACHLEHRTYRDLGVLNCQELSAARRQLALTIPLKKAD